MPINRCNQAGITETPSVWTTARREIQQQKNKIRGSGSFQAFKFFFSLTSLYRVSHGSRSLSSHAPWTRLITTFSMFVYADLKSTSFIFLSFLTIYTNFYFIIYDNSRWWVKVENASWVRALSTFLFIHCNDFMIVYGHSRIRELRLLLYDAFETCALRF